MLQINIRFSLNRYRDFTSLSVTFPPLLLRSSPLPIDDYVTQTLPWPFVFQPQLEADSRPILSSTSLYISTLHPYHLPYLILFSFGAGLPFVCSLGWLELQDYDGKIVNTLDTVHWIVKKLRSWRENHFYPRDWRLRFWSTVTGWMNVHGRIYKDKNKIAKGKTRLLELLPDLE